MPSTERVVVTGLGCLAAGCAGAEGLWRRLLSGESAIAPLAAAEQNGSRLRVGAEIEEIDKRSLGVSRKELRYLDVVSTYGLIAAQEATRSAGLDSDEQIERDEIGLAMALFSGPLSLSRREPNVNLFAAAVSAYYGSVIGNITIPLKFCGPSSTHLNLDLASVDAIGYAYEVIRHRKARVMLAGGTDSGFNTFVLAQLDEAGLLSGGEHLPQLACQHADRERNGAVLGEGAAVVVLEGLESAVRRGRPILAEVLGYQTAGAGLAENAMSSLMARSGFEPAQVDCIVANTTGCPAVDRLQVESVQAVFGEVEDQPPTTSITWAIGHTLGAAGAMQAVTAATILKEQRVPPVGALVNGHGSCCLNQLKTPDLDISPRVVLGSTFGFAGDSGFLAFGKYE